MHHAPDVEPHVDSLLSQWLGGTICKGRCGIMPGVINHHDKPHLAVHCQWLKRTIEPGRPEPIVMLCQHPIREGKDCVGPFLEDLPTNCGLWDPHPQSHLIPLPEPERWQRRRREGFDYQRTWNNW